MVSLWPILLTEVCSTVVMYITTFSRVKWGISAGGEFQYFCQITTRGKLIQRSILQHREWALGCTIYFGCKSSMYKSDSHPASEGIQGPIDLQLAEGHIQSSLFVLCFLYTRAYRPFDFETFLSGYVVPIYGYFLPLVLQSCLQLKKVESDSTSLHCMEGWINHFIPLQWKEPLFMYFKHWCQTFALLAGPVPNYNIPSTSWHSTYQHFMHAAWQ